MLKILSYLTLLSFSLLAYKTATIVSLFSGFDCRYLRQVLSDKSLHLHKQA